jgi:hypothetical protein
LHNPFPKICTFVCESIKLPDVETEHGGGLCGRKRTTAGKERAFPIYSDCGGSILAILRDCRRGVLRLPLPKKVRKQ